MIHLGSPYTKADIIAALTTEHQTVQAFFETIADELFFTAPPAVWTPADNLVHLIKSCSPIMMAMKLPKAALRLRFGKAKHPSRSLSEIRAAYMAIAAQGQLIAPSTFQPLVEAHTTAEKERILAKWEQKGAEFTEVIAKWSEDDLDQYVLPHPLLGNLTMREMLLFTIYHNMHHVNDVQGLLNRAHVEWFEAAEGV